MNDNVIWQAPAPRWFDLAAARALAAGGNWVLAEAQGVPPYGKERRAAQLRLIGRANAIRRGRIQSFAVGPFDAITRSDHDRVRLFIRCRRCPHCGR